MSSTAKSFIEGILTHPRGLMPMIEPTPNYYRRLKGLPEKAPAAALSKLKLHTFAPSKVSWGIEDRSSMVRVKATHDNRTHFEILLTENESIEVS